MKLSLYCAYCGTPVVEEKATLLRVRGMLEVFHPECAGVHLKDETHDAYWADEDARRTYRTTSAEG